MERAIADLNDAKKCQCKFYLEDCGYILDYLGMNFVKTNGNLKLYQPQMIKQIIAEVGVDIIRILKPTPVAFTKIIHWDIKAAAFDH